MTQPSWFDDVPPDVAGVWQASNNSGGTWFAYTPGTNIAQVVGPTGTQRFRRFFTVPAGIPQTVMSISWSGDLYEAPTNIPSQLYIDGVLVAGAAPPGASGSGQFLIPAAGTHEVQIWVGQANAAGLSRLDTVNAEIFNVIPCDCCPSVPPACANVAVLFSGVSETVSQAGWVPVNLPGTIDGITATATLSGYNSPSGTTASTTLRVTYTVSPPQQRVRGLRLWNQGGGDLNDSDGLGTFTAEFYSGATLLASLITSGANGGSAQDLLLPPGTQLSNVDSVVLRNLGKLSGSTVSPLWRELQLLEFQTVLPCRRPNGTLQWYDVNGNLVPTSSVVDCATGASAFVSVPDFRMDGQAFGDGPDPAGENLCSVIPTPVSTVNLTPTGVCYDPTVAGSIQMTWTSTTSVEMEYGNPPHTSGGVNMQFSSPTLGSVTWPTNVNSMAVGEQRTSNVFGGSRRAVLTYLSGPASTAPSLTIRMTGGANLSLHQGTTDNTTPAMRWRIDFVSA